MVLRDVSGNDLDKLSLSDCTGSQGQVTADFNGDGIVNFADFFDFVDAFGTTDAQYDLDGNGIVNFRGLLRVCGCFRDVRVSGRVSRMIGSTYTLSEVEGRLLKRGH